MKGDVAYSTSRSRSYPRPRRATVLARSPAAIRYRRFPFDVFVVAALIATAILSTGSRTTASVNLPSSQPCQIQTRSASRSHGVTIRPSMRMAARGTATRCALSTVPRLHRIAPASFHRSPLRSRYRADDPVDGPRPHCGANNRISVVSVRSATAASLAGAGPTDCGDPAAQERTRP